MGLKFNNLTGSVNTPLCRASVLPCAWISVGDGSLAERGPGSGGGGGGWGWYISGGARGRRRCSQSRLSPESQQSSGRSPA